MTNSDTHQLTNAGTDDESKRFYVAGPIEIPTRLAQTSSPPFTLIDPIEVKTSSLIQPIIKLSISFCK